MTLDLFIIIAVFAGVGLIGIGFMLGRITKTDYRSQRQTPLTLEDMAKHYANVRIAEKEEEKEQLKADPIAEKLSQKDDLINHEGVGIVYRPTEEELAKMQEPQQVREAKEAMAETIRNTPLPEI